jgi:hypothetical protein
MYVYLLVFACLSRTAADKYLNKDIKCNNSESAMALSFGISASNRTISPDTNYKCTNLRYINGIMQFKNPKKKLIRLCRNLDQNARFIYVTNFRVEGKQSHILCYRSY